jgi:predicted Rossmann fold nucleotide-binding protein DprA/Smf involved in DNA uptake
MVDLLTQAVLLLTAHLGKVSPGQPKPLGPTEYGRFALWLKERGLHPENLLLEGPDRVLAEWSDSGITLDRITYLLGRAAALGLVLEKWERAGLWVITRADADYPARLKKLLKTDSPPALIGSGNRTLLNAGGVAVVGSRDATEAERAFAAHLGELAAQEEVCVVSGGAGGIDESAMLGALESGGAVVGVLADHLLRATTSTKFRAALMEDRLALVSPFNPEAGFDVGNAMARNRYIYCLADAAVVVAASEGKGGTWNGAIQNLKHGWVPLWVKSGPERESGNAAIVARGGRWLPERFRVSDLSQGTVGPDGSDTEDDVPRMSARLETASNGAPLSRPREVESYAFFLQRVEALASPTAATPKQLAAALDLPKSQLTIWLNRAVGEARLTKLNKPVRYIWTQAPTTQPSLFKAEH